MCVPKNARDHTHQAMRARAHAGFLHRSLIQVIMTRVRTLLLHANRLAVIHQVPDVLHAHPDQYRGGHCA